MSDSYKKKDWDDFLLPNGKTVGFMRKDNIDWWNREGKATERWASRVDMYNIFENNAKTNNPDFSYDSYKNSGLKIGEACGGPYGGIIEGNFPEEDKYQIDIFADSFKDMGWISSDPKKTTWIESPCEEIPLEDNFLDVVFAFNSIDHGWDVFASITELVRISKECYISFDTNKHLNGHKDLNHYQKVDLEEVTAFMDNNFSNQELYDMKYLTWKPSFRSNVDVFDFWVKKK